MFFIPITALFVLKFTKYLAGKYRRVYRYRKLMVRNIEFLKMGFSLAKHYYAPYWKYHIRRRYLY